MIHTTLYTERIKAIICNISTLKWLVLCYIFGELYTFIIPNVSTNIQTQRNLEFIQDGAFHLVACQIPSSYNFTELYSQHCNPVETFFYVLMHFNTEPAYYNASHQANASTRSVIFSRIVFTTDNSVVGLPHDWICHITWFVPDSCQIFSPAMVMEKTSN